MAFSIITDSTADIHPDLAAERGIEVVPLSVTIAGKTITDGSITQDEFFRRMEAAPELPTTSQPSVGLFVEAYERALSAADEVVSIHIAEKLSGTIGSARQAAEQFAGRVHVFDSYNLSGGLALQVLDAARSAANGLTAATTLERLEQIRNRSRMLVGLDSLANLAKGGRIGKVSAFFGSVLDLKVSLFPDPEQGGAFMPAARSRGEKAALRQTLEWVAEQMGESTRARFMIGYAQKRERAEWLVERLREQFELVEEHIYEAGAVVCSHTGTGWGIALLPED